ncbi:hypothetical protein NDU88_006324 [Pleurodeles waltl]|uniref:Uncharacterized protein n=1 Tax=Pleurodeles waltl TaxID=8319 RepID=A0AAV7MFI9_PLEWA|nr:hypothetical protein NDU88_006324 [Pleurodeles waltl]
MHRWADVLDREDDLLNLLGVEVAGLGQLKRTRRGRKSTTTTNGDQDKDNTSASTPAIPSVAEFQAIHTDEEDKYHPVEDKYHPVEGDQADAGTSGWLRRCRVVDHSGGFRDHRRTERKRGGKAMNKGHLMYHAARSEN